MHCLRKRTPSTRDGWMWVTGRACRSVMREGGKRDWRILWCSFGTLRSWMLLFWLIPLVPSWSKQHGTQGILKNPLVRHQGLRLWADLNSDLQGLKGHCRPRPYFKHSFERYSKVFQVDPTACIHFPRRFSGNRGHKNCIFSEPEREAWIFTSFVHY